MFSFDKIRLFYNKHRTSPPLSTDLQVTEQVNGSFSQKLDLEP